MKAKKIECKIIKVLHNMDLLGKKGMHIQADPFLFHPRLS